MAISDRTIYQIEAILFYLPRLVLLPSSILLLLFAFLAPVAMLHDQVAFLTVTPSLKMDGPSVFLGILGSCSRMNSSAELKCTSLNLSNTYDLSILPKDALGPLTGPSLIVRILTAFSLVLQFAYFAMVLLLSFPDNTRGKWTSTAAKRSTRWVCVVSGLSGLVFNICPFSFMFTRYYDAVKNFHSPIEFEAPGLVAATGNALIMTFIAYVFYAIGFCAVLKTLNVK